MITDIAIKNFQSHKLTNIHFVPGVNVLVGSSDQGKSAILRALLWAVNNRPTGTDDILSHWARDDKGKIIDDMIVKVSTDWGIVTRTRGSNFNGYTLREDGKTKQFEAINKDVPDDVIKLFRLTDVNIQQQHDAPFLLSASPGDVAKYFNKIVRLDVIDKVLSNVESSRRDINKQIKTLMTEKEALEKSLKSYDWLPQAEELAEKLSQVSERYVYYKDSCNILGGEIEKYRTIKDELKLKPDTKLAFKLINQIDDIKIDYQGVKALENQIQDYKLLNRDRKLFTMVEPGNQIIKSIHTLTETLTDLKQNYMLIDNQISQYQDNKKAAKIDFDKSVALKYLREIETIHPPYDEFRMLSIQIKDYEGSLSDRDNATDAAQGWKDQLPDICPVCGKPLEKE
jgi:ABC-type phosphate/phosphonate transport system ATPase subunit